MSNSLYHSICQKHFYKTKSLDRADMQLASKLSQVPGMTVQKACRLMTRPADAASFLSKAGQKTKPAAKAKPKQARAARAQDEALDRERARCKAIMQSPEAKGREDLAKRLALETNLSPELARKKLAAVPKDDEDRDEHDDDDELDPLEDEDDEDEDDESGKESTARNPLIAAARRYSPGSLRGKA